MSERYRTARVLLTEARARRLSGVCGFWFLIGAASRARRRAAAAPPTPEQLDIFGA